MEGVIGVMFGVLITGWFTSKIILTMDVVKTIFEERATWREMIRKETAEFCKIGYILSSQYKSNDNNEVAKKVERLAELGGLIRLKLNPKGNPHEINVIESTKKVFNALNENNHEEIKKLLMDIEKGIQSVLKEAWDVSKTEASTGKVEVSSKKKQA